MAEAPAISSQILFAGAFQSIAAIAKAEAGLVLTEGKMTMVQSRLRRRLAESGQPDYESYCRFVTSPEGAAELRNMISSLTTNVSHFFREKHHFGILRDKLVPRLIEKVESGERVRIWSAGCFSGQEPFSIGMTLLDAWPEFHGKDVRILGTDIDPEILKRARAAVFSEQQIAAVPPTFRGRFLTRIGQEYRVGQRVLDMVRFNELNLLRAWPMRGQFDAIFCRNVVIYFDGFTQAALWPRFHNQLTADGWLFVGHSERVTDQAQPIFASRGMTAYQKVSAEGSTQPGTSTAQLHPAV